MIVRVKQLQVSSADEKLTRGSNVPMAILGKSGALEAVLAKIARIAVTDLPVYLVGETGTGKELVARRVHELSSRSKRAFVSVNCAAVPEKTFESSFFGHVQGAFSGADRDHDGYFRTAVGGTLFLDEIGELPLDLQAKVLRALEGFIQPVGGKTEQPVDVRIVAATNRNLAEAVNEGIFREDLMRRLGVALELPPLRKRDKDILLLADAFAKPKTLSAEARSALSSFHWPGNVRQLRNVIRYAAVYAEGDEITLADLGAELEAAATPVNASPDDDALLTSFCKASGLTTKALMEVLIAAGAAPSEWERVLRRHREEPNVMMGDLQRLTATGNSTRGTSGSRADADVEVPFERCLHDRLPALNGGDHDVDMRAFPKQWLCKECFDAAEGMVRDPADDAGQDLLRLLHAVSVTVKKADGKGNIRVSMGQLRPLLPDKPKVWTDIKQVPQAKSLIAQLEELGNVLAKNRAKTGGRPGMAGHKQKLRKRNTECIVIADLCKSENDVKCLERINELLRLAGLDER